MCRVLIVAFGNPLRCDDGLAWRAAEELSRQISDPDVRILTTHQLTPELSQTVSQASSVIFLDAARSGVPGEIVLTSLLPERPCSVFTHDFSPGGILNLSHNLYGRCPQATLASVCGECFEHGESVSRTVEAALPGLVARIIELVKAAGQV